MVLKTGRDRQCGTSLSSPLLSSRIRGFLWLCHTRKGLFAASIAQETVTRSAWNAMKRAELSAGTVMAVVQLATGMKSGSALLVMDANRWSAISVTVEDDRSAALATEMGFLCLTKRLGCWGVVRASCTPSSPRRWKSASCTRWIWIRRWFPRAVETTSSRRLLWNVSWVERRRVHWLQFLDSRIRTLKRQWQRCIVRCTM